jgi:hypothetical protein
MDIDREDYSAGSATFSFQIPIWIFDRDVGIPESFADEKDIKNIIEGHYDKSISRDRSLVNEEQRTFQGKKMINLTRIYKVLSKPSAGQATQILATQILQVIKDPHGTSSFPQLPSSLTLIIPTASGLIPLVATSALGLVSGAITSTTISTANELLHSTGNAIMGTGNAFMDFVNSCGTSVTRVLASGVCGNSNSQASTSSSSSIHPTGKSNVKLSLTAKDSGSTRDGEGRLRKWSSRSLDSETDFNQQNSILLTTVTELNGKILQLEAKLLLLVYTCENPILVYTLNKQLPFYHQKHHELISVSSFYHYFQQNVSLVMLPDWVVIGIHLS